MYGISYTHKCKSANTNIPWHQICLFSFLFVYKAMCAMSLSWSIRVQCTQQTSQKLRAYVSFVLSNMARRYWKCFQDYFGQCRCDMQIAPETKKLVIPRFLLTLSYLLTYLLLTSLNFGLRCLSAAILLQQNVIALIEGSETKNSACALSTVTGIPLVCLHGDKKCKKTVQMMVGHKAYARASLDIISRFKWEKVTLVFEGTKFK